MLRTNRIIKIGKATLNNSIAFLSDFDSIIDDLHFDNREDRAMLGSNLSARLYEGDRRPSNSEGLAPFSVSYHRKRKIPGEWNEPVFYYLEYYGQVS